MDNAKLNTENTFENFWTIENIAEFSYEVAVISNKRNENQENKEWDAGIDWIKELALEFIKRKKFYVIYNNLVISDNGKTVICDKAKLHELIQFLYNKQDLIF